MAAENGETHKKVWWAVEALLCSYDPSPTEDQVVKRSRDPDSLPAEIRPRRVINTRAAFGQELPLDTDFIPR